MPINRWNMLHLIAPFFSLLIVLFILNGRTGVNAINYHPGVLAFVSLVLIAVSMIWHLKVKETVKNFIAFLPVYPFWFFAAIVPYFEKDALSAAWSSDLIFLLGLIFSIIIGEAIKTGEN